MPLPAISLAVVGADHPNKKRGPTRRFEIAMCEPGEPVDLVLEPANPADPLAVAVISARGIQIGYLTAERCGWIGHLLAEGRVSGAIFQCPTSYGAMIRAGFDGEPPTMPTVQMSSPASPADWDGVDTIYEGDE